MAARQLGLLTRVEALEAGLSGDALDRRVASGALVPVHRGVYRLAAVPETLLQRCLAATLAAGPGAITYRRAAAVVHGFDPGEPALEVAIPTSRRVRVPGVTGFRTDRLAKADTSRFHTVRATDPTRTIIDLAGVLPERRLSLVLDDALARRLTAVPVLERRLAGLAPQRLTGRRTLVDLLGERRGKRARFRSGLEREVLRLIRKARLPEPVLQHEVRLRNGRKAIVDLAYPDHRLAIEVDSYRYHGELTAWSADHARNNELTALGWRVLHLPDDLVVERPEAVPDLVGRALEPAR